MKLLDLLDHFSHRVTAIRQNALVQSLDASISPSAGRLLRTVGTLHLYEWTLPTDLSRTLTPLEDIPVTILPADCAEPTEGLIVGGKEGTIVVQTFDHLGQNVPSAIIVPDADGFFQTVLDRLSDVLHHAESYSLGPAERLVPWLTQDPFETRSPSAVLSTLWGDDLGPRRLKVASTIVELVRANKRVLLLCPDHGSADEVSGMIAKSLRAAGLTFKSLLSRYEMAIEEQATGMSLGDLGFEAQMHQFYAKSRTEKASLRKKYDRFRELTPLLAYKAEKQRDLDEVKLLEWRLFTQISDFQNKIKEIDTTLAEYQAIPIWKRLALQTVGKNVESLAEYRTIYDAQIKLLMSELETAQERMAELKPEAAIPKELRPEYQELKDDVTRLGGTKKIRELLAAEEGTNRQAFIQNKRIIVTTAARLVSDPLFRKVRFDVMLADEAPLIPAPYLLGAAALIRDKIILSGNMKEIPTPDAWISPFRRIKNADPSPVNS